jgi:hypothetical protein
VRVGDEYDHRNLLKQELQSTKRLTANAGQRDTRGADGTGFTRNNRYRETRAEMESQRQPGADAGEQVQG